MTATFYTTDGTIGARIGETNTTAKFTLGTRVTANNGTTFVYVQSSGANAKYGAVAIDKDYQATALTAALAATAQIIGLAQIVFADNEYGWVGIDGNGLYALIDGTADVNPGVALAPSTIAAGLLALLTISGQYQAAGIRTVTTASGTTVTTQVVLNNPHLVLKPV